MPTPVNLQGMILNAWKTNQGVTAFLIERLPDDLWEEKIPGSPRRTIRMLGSHLHNVRCAWIRTLGKEHGIVTPASVDRFKVNQRELVAAMEKSGAGILSLLQLGCDHGGQVPDSKGYVWRNLPLDVGHVLSYFAAHEAHHRGQIVMLARQLGHRLPVEVTGGLWEFSRLVRSSAKAAKSK